MRISTLSFLVCFLYSVCSSAQKAYIPHGGGGILVINTDLKYTVTDISATYTNTNAMRVSPDGSKLYLASNGINDKVVLVVDTKTDAVTDVIALGTTASFTSFAVSPDSLTLYCVVVGLDTTINNDSLFVVNLQTKRVASKMVVPFPAHHTGEVIVSPDGKKLYVAANNKLEVFDAATGAVLSTIVAADTNESFIGSLAVSPDGTRLYAADKANQKIIVVNAFADTVLTSMPAGARPYTDDPIRIIVTPDGSKLYADNPSSMGISVIDAVADTVIHTLLPANFPANNICLSLDGTRLYATSVNYPKGVLSILNTSDNDALLSNININVYPQAYGDFVNGSAPPAREDSFVVSPTEAAAIAGNYFTPLQNTAGQTIAEINPNNNNLGTTAWGANVGTGTDFQNTIGWFGGDQKQDGAFLNRNVFITPANQPTSATTVRIYCTSVELKSFIDSFNARYGTQVTEKDIRIVKYDGSNVDLDRSNNDDNGTAYTSIVPSQVGYYGFSNTYRYFEFPVSSYSEFYITLSVPAGVLPVKLVTFTAEKKNNDVVLNWEISAGENVSHFDVERSADGITFAKMSSVSVSNSTLPLQTYSTVDSYPVSPKTFYRLQIVEKDGSHSYSGLVVVDFGFTKRFTLYPNPAGKTLTIQFHSAGQKVSQVRVVNANGRIVKTVPVADNNAMSVTIDITDLAKGVYTVVAGDTHTSFIKGN